MTSWVSKDPMYALKGKRYTTFLFTGGKNITPNTHLKYP